MNSFTSKYQHQFTDTDSVELATIAAAIYDGAWPMQLTKRKFNLGMAEEKIVSDSESVRGNFGAQRAMRAVDCATQLRTLGSCKQFQALAEAHLVFDPTDLDL